MPRWTVLVAAVVIAALLAAGLAGALTVGPERPGSAAGTTTTTTRGPAASSSTTVAGATTTTAVAGSIEAVVPAIEAYVERARGLTFTMPVKVTHLGDKEFEARVTEADAKDLEETRHAEEVLKAMGLLDAGVDLAAIVRTYSAGAVLGFYDPKSKDLVVRGITPTPFVRSVLAHELTHALEDQRFGLERDDLGDEASLAFSALAEGSAMTIEQRYRRSLPAADRVAAAKEERSQGGRVPDVPEAVRAIFAFPYAFGPDLIAAILKAGGQARLDAAYKDPPASTEEVLDPERYLGGDTPKVVAKPTADATAFDDGEIGELALALMLRSELDAATARTAAQGWGGDHYVAWKDGDRTCVRMTFVMDTPTDTAELTAALGKWASRRKGAAIATGTSVRTCG